VFKPFVFFLRKTVYFHGRPAHALTLTLVYFHGRPAHTYSKWSNCNRWPTEMEKRKSGRVVMGDLPR
jgi:hypothetical protein